MLKSNIKLVLNDMREDWHDTDSLRQFIRWQYIKLSDGFRFGAWPWTSPNDEVQS